MTEHKQEVWKPIEGYENCYEVSNFGNVKRLAGVIKNGIRTQAIHEKILKPAQSNYLNVSLWKDGKLKVKKVHRLVAQAFIENPYNKPEVNHIDANRSNNTVNNLEWVTRQENCNHAKNLKLNPKGDSHKHTKIKDEDIPKIFEMYCQNLTQQQIATKFNCSQTNISFILRGATRNG